ncbi:MAG TPA: hypothetical protein VN426_04295, partial [Syntrophomonadaceae bacterium]|nr:hypothetical protein [Syntrophomonadaceae bacterium]
GVILGDSNKIVAKNAIYIRNILQDKPLEVTIMGFSIDECKALLAQIEKDIEDKLGEIRKMGNRKLLTMEKDSKNNNEFFDLLTTEQAFRDELNFLNKMEQNLSHIIYKIPAPGVIEIEKSLCSKLTVSIGSNSLEVAPFRKKSIFIHNDEEECLIMK